MSTTLVDSNEYYTSKYGRIAILTGDNYASFASTCRTALVVAGAWNIVNGSEPRPGGAAGRTWDELNRKAIQLISSSVASSIHSRIDTAILAEDPMSMWTELTKEDRSSSQLHQNTLFSQFHNAVWDPSKESIRVFHGRLENIRAQLASTPRALTESDILWRIITAIPISTSSEWRQAKQFCLLNQLDLTQVIATLQSFQWIKTPPQSRLLVQYQTRKIKDLRTLTTQIRAVKRAKEGGRERRMAECQSQRMILVDAADLGKKRVYASGAASQGIDSRIAMHTRRLMKPIRLIRSSI